MTISNKTILVLAPHTDDGEFGAGASLKKWVNDGNNIFYVAFSSCQDSIPDGYPKNILENELAEAMRVIGIKNIQILDYTVRRFDQRRQDILDDIIKLREKINPDLVLMPDCNDLHQDHQVVSREGLRAFKNTSVLYYEMPWNNIQFKSEAFVELSDRDVQAKIDAIKCYKSQSTRAYTQEGYIKSHLLFRGTQIGKKFAETFSVVRWML